MSIGLVLHPVTSFVFYCDYIIGGQCRTKDLTTLLYPSRSVLRSPVSVDNCLIVGFPRARYQYSATRNESIPPPPPPPPPLLDFLSVNTYKSNNNPFHCVIWGDIEWDNHLRRVRVPGAMCGRCSYPIKGM